MNSSFDPLVDLTPVDLQVDSSTNPQSFQVFIKCAKTDPFRRGCFIFLGRGSAPLCPVLVLTNYLHLRGPGFVEGPSVFISAIHLTGSWHSGEVLRPQL